MIFQIEETFEQEIFVPMYKYLFLSSTCLAMETDASPILLDFDKAEIAEEFQQTISKIHDDILAYYVFTVPKLEIKRQQDYQARKEEHLSRLTLKSILSDGVHLLKKNVSKMTKKVTGTMDKIPIIVIYSYC